jgi:hypothetical protein
MSYAQAVEPVDALLVADEPCVREALIAREIA